MTDSIDINFESKVIKKAKKLRRLWKIKYKMPFITKVLIFLE